MAWRHGRVKDERRTIGQHYREAVCSLILHHSDIVAVVDDYRVVRDRHRRLYGRIMHKSSYLKSRSGKTNEVAFPWTRIQSPGFSSSCFSRSAGLVEISVDINRSKLSRFAGAVEASTIDWTIFFAPRIAAGPRVSMCVAFLHSISSASDTSL